MVNTCKKIDESYSYYDRMSQGLVEKIGYNAAGTQVACGLRGYLKKN